MSQADRNACGEKSPGNDCTGKGDESMRGSSMRSGESGGLETKLPLIIRAVIHSGGNAHQLKMPPLALQSVFLDALIGCGSWVKGVRRAGLDLLNYLCREFRADWAGSVINAALGQSEPAATGAGL